MVDLLVDSSGGEQREMVGLVSEYTPGGSLILVADQLLSVPSVIFRKNLAGQYLEEPIKNLAVGQGVQAIVSKKVTEGVQETVVLAIVEDIAQSEGPAEPADVLDNKKGKRVERLRLENGVWLNE
ncbi:hypothetical protein [Desulfotalea psychrophila]|nr:hypothetical protein [Desulfotalea psychrophila]